jgi:hypothetical protein
VRDKLQPESRVSIKFWTPAFAVTVQQRLFFPTSAHARPHDPASKTLEAEFQLPFPKKMDEESLWITT